MSAMTNFRAEDMPGANKPMAKQAAPKKAATPAKKAAKVETPAVEEVVEVVVEEATTESE